MNIHAMSSVDKPLKRKERETILVFIKAHLENMSNSLLAINLFLHDIILINAAIESAKYQTSQ